MVIFSKNDWFWLKKDSGFTLIEILIVIALLALLSTAFFGNFFTSLQRGRDSRRKQDLALMGKALELYYNDHNVYPTEDVSKTGHFVFGATFTDGLTNYMQQVPKDPRQISSGINYAYVYDSNPPGGGGSGYKLYACIENKSDPQITPAGYPSTNCGNCLGGSSLCNYGISSQNTTP